MSLWQWTIGVRLAPRGGSLIAAGLCLAGVASAAEPAREAIEFFEKKIRPVLVEHCYKCHSADAKQVQGGFLLDTRDGLLTGGDSGPAVVPGKPENSLLLEAIRYESFEMPPDGRLPAAVVADFEKWIRAGAADPRAADPRSGAIAAPKPAGFDVEAGRQFWSFQPPRRHAPPDVADALWPEGPIDRFVLARLEAAGLEPNAPADPRVWMRRVTFDLLGLPPAPEDMAEFVDDPSPEARQKVVDRWLASVQHGEHRARLWLDVSRYAEDQAHIVGDDKSMFYPNAWRYRDWIVRAFNADLPYDEFVRLQLAADLVSSDDPADDVALGFLGLGPKYYSRRNLAVMSDEWEDRVDTVGRGLLGLTVACARCHDHKFDPIPTEDYYALAGVFASTEMFNRPLDDKRKTKDNGQAEEPPDALHIVREGEPTDLSVFVRGDVKTKGPIAPRRFLRVLCEGEPEPFTSGSGRRELAEAIACRENPLTARVIVNGMWGALTGGPLVGTPSNFGALGEPPTHPELLDDLAVRFSESDWSLKRLEREIVLSATYAQASIADDARIAADPSNRLLGRMNRRRLTAEAWRDALLSASGRLSLALGGPSMDPQHPDETRRTLYSEASRLDLNKMLAMFDFPDPNIHADRRVETTTPLQKMFVLNSPFMVRQAGALAERLLSEVPDGDGSRAERIERAYELLYGREPGEDELELGLAFLEIDPDSPDRWQQYAHVLLASNELLFVD